MEVKVVSKYDIGDAISTRTFGMVRVIKIKVQKTDAYAYEFIYLLEDENRTKIWWPERYLCS